MFFAINDFSTTMTTGPHKHLSHWLNRSKEQLALIRSLTVRIELPGNDFYLDLIKEAVLKSTEDAKLYASGEEFWKLQSGPTAADLSTILTIINRFVFGKRPFESVVRFSVNGAADSIRYNDTWPLDGVDDLSVRKHTTAELLMMIIMIKVKSSAINDMFTKKFVGSSYVLELEERMHAGMQRRLVGGQRTKRARCGHVVLAWWF